MTTPSGTPGPLHRRARLCFRTTAEGGRRTAPGTGVRPQLVLDDGTQTSCTVQAVDGRDTIPLGEPVVVVLTPLHPEAVGERLGRLRTIVLREGDRVVASGDFLDTAPRWAV